MLLHQIEQLLHAKRRELGLHRDLVDRRVAVQLLTERTPGALDSPHLVGDMHGQPDRPALLGERPLHRLPNPPGRIGRELVAHRPVELLDGADEPEIALLDQIEERHVGARVVPRDRHDEPQIRLDQLLLGELVSLVFPPGELALLDGREQPPVTDRTDVQLQRILDGLPGLGFVLRLCDVVEEGLGCVRLHVRRIGRWRPPLEAFVDMDPPGVSRPIPNRILTGG